MKLIVGLDVSSTKLDACFMTSDSELPVLYEASFSNDILGASNIKEMILKYNDDYTFSSIVVGMEATSIYSFHPAIFFKEDKDLQKLNSKVYVEQPNKIKRYREIYDESKNDKIDAYYIADYFRVNRNVHTVIKQEEYLALQNLTRSRLQIIEQLVEVKQHFIENIYYKCNTLGRELKADNGSTSVLSASIMTLMSENYTLDDLANMPLEKFVDLLNKLGRGNFKDPEKIAKAISRAIASSYHLSKVQESSVSIILGVLAREIRALEKAIKELDKAIEDIVKILPEYQCLTSIPGIGPVYAAGIIAEIGQIDRFNDNTKIAKYAGLYWREKQSGKMRSENTPMAKHGNRYLRYYLVEATNSVRRYVAEYSDYYHKKYSEVHKHQHKRAIVLTARKFVRLVDVLLRNHQLYTPRGGDKAIK